MTTLRTMTMTNTATTWIARTTTILGARARRIVAPVVTLVVVAFVALAAMSSTAFAQEFQKVEGKLVDDVPAVPFVGIAYGFIWLAVLVYVLVLARGLGRVKTEIEDLRRKLDAAGTPHK